MRRYSVSCRRITSRMFTSQLSIRPYCLLRPPRPRRRSRSGPPPKCPSRPALPRRTAARYSRFMSECTTRLAMLRCTNISPGPVPVMPEAGTRESEQPMNRYSGLWPLGQALKELGVFGVMLRHPLAVVFENFADSSHNISGKRNNYHRSFTPFGAERCWMDLGKTIYGAKGKRVSPTPTRPPARTAGFAGLQQCREQANDCSHLPAGCRVAPARCPAPGPPAGKPQWPRARRGR